MNYSHIELMNILEHSGDDAWAGYRVSGFFSPTHRHGTREDFQFLVNELHNAGIGVILDWIPEHFESSPKYGLGNFDGTPIYESQDTAWGCHKMKYSDPSVRDFCLSSADYWCRKMHIDGLRVDNIDGIIFDHSHQLSPACHQFCRDFNAIIHREHPGVFTVAEDTSEFTITSKPSSEWTLDRSSWGLNFDYRWDAWLSGTIRHFMSIPSHYRTGDNYRNVVGMVDGLRVNDEKWTLGFSHDDLRVDECGNGSMFMKMPGNHTEKMRNLKLLYSFQKFLPTSGSLNFMGNDFAHKREWPLHVHNGYASKLNWEDQEAHGEFTAFMQYLNQFDLTGTDFEWIQNDDPNNSVLAFRRDDLIFVFNFGPTDHPDYELKTSQEASHYQTLFSSRHGLPIGPHPTENGMCL